MSKKKQQRSVGKPTKNAAASRREELRARQEAEAKKARRMKVFVVTAIVVVVAVIATVGIVAFNKWREGQQAGSRQDGVSAEQIIPSTVAPDSYSLAISKENWVDGTPQVKIFLDPQCPGCGGLERAHGKALAEFASQGKIQLSYQVAHFLDRGFGTNHSYNGAIALSCAADVNKFSDYAFQLFSNQPANEGDGWPEADIRDTYAANAGISGGELKKFQTCYDSKQTNDFVKKMDENLPDDMRSTPSIYVNGKNVKLTNADLATAESLLAMIEREAA